MIVSRDYVQAVKSKLDDESGCCMDGVEMHHIIVQMQDLRSLLGS